MTVGSHVFFTNRQGERASGLGRTFTRTDEEPNLVIQCSRRYKCLGLGHSCLNYLLGNALTTR